MSAANDDVEEIPHLEIFTYMISIIYLEVRMHCVPHLTVA